MALEPTEEMLSAADMALKGMEVTTSSGRRIALTAAYKAFQGVDEPPTADEAPTAFINLSLYLSDPQVKIRIAIAVKAALDAFSQRQKLGRGIATEEAAKVLTEIVLDALSPEADLIAAATNDGGAA